MEEDICAILTKSSLLGRGAQKVKMAKLENSNGLPSVQPFVKLSVQGNMASIAG